MKTCDSAFDCLALKMSLSRGFWVAFLWRLAPSLRSGAATDFDLAGGGEYAFFEGHSLEQFCQLLNYSKIGGGEWI